MAAGVTFLAVTWADLLHRLPAPLVHAGHAHTLKEKLVDLLGVLGVLLLFLGLVVVPVGAWVYAKIAATLLKVDPPPPPQAETTPPQETPTPPVG